MQALLELVEQVLTSAMPAAWCTPTALAWRFFSGVLEAVEGEKDPRVLLVALRVSAALMTAAVDTERGRGSIAAGAGAAARSGGDDGRTAEALVAWLALYFPITFRPPANDPHRITHRPRPILPSPHSRGRRLHDRYVPPRPFRYMPRGVL